MILIIKDDGLVHTTYNLAYDYSLYDLNPDCTLVYVPNDYILEYPTTSYTDEDGNQHEIRNGLAPDPRPDMNLDLLKICSDAQVDIEAEYNRLKFLTNGSGQSLEYTKTSDDAMRAYSAPDPLDPTQYPWINAEWQAILSVGGTISFRDIVNIVMGQVIAWTQFGSFIKEVRRTVKMKIDASTTNAEVLSYFPINWNPQQLVIPTDVPSAEPFLPPTNP